MLAAIDVSALDCPFDNVTTMFAGPLPSCGGAVPVPGGSVSAAAGIVTVIDVLLLTVKLAEETDALPTCTPATFWNPLPWIVTVSPPTTEPEFGVRLVTTGLDGATAIPHRSAARPAVPPGPVSRGVPRPVARSYPFVVGYTRPLSKPKMSLFPDVMSLNEAAYSVGFEATAYSSGGAKPMFVSPSDEHDADEFTSASIAAQIGDEDEVPPIVDQPPR